MSFSAACKGPFDFAAFTAQLKVVPFHSGELFRNLSSPLTVRIVYITGKAAGSGCLSCLSVLPV
jgi:hypothetical protein